MCYRVIIPVFNPPSAFLEHLETMMHNELNFPERTILVDDASTNGVVGTLKSRFPSLEVIKGNGDLWWCGGMRKGMERAIEHGAEAVVWLNHDCLPDPGAIDALVQEAVKPGRGAVSAWCYCKEDRRYPVNPGFRNFREIPREELERGGVVRVDGVNGNCVAISAAAIREVGLPRADLHPHYGDGPYTWRLHRAGFENAVLTTARAALSREFERCIDEKWHSALWRAPLAEKLRYYFFSYRSKYHWLHRFHDACVFHGSFRAAPRYIAGQAKLLFKVISGHLLCSRGVDSKITAILAAYPDNFPPDAFRRSLEETANRERQ